MSIKIQIYSPWLKLDWNSHIVPRTLYN
jgi:hypothetical protein